MNGELLSVNYEDTIGNWLTVKSQSNTFIDAYEK